MAIMYDDSSREVCLLFSRIWIRLVAHLTHVPARQRKILQSVMAIQVLTVKAKPATPAKIPIDYI